MEKKPVINQNLKRVRPSGLRKLFDLSKLWRGERPLISFGIGDLNIDLPEELKRTIPEIFANPQATRYGPNHGLKVLREQLRKKYKRKYNVDIDPETQIIITCGGIEGLFDTMAAYINPGDEIIMQDPSFAYIGNQAAFFGATVKWVPSYDDFTLDIEALRKTITEKTKLLVVITPSNPTGAVMTRKQLQAVIDVAAEHDIILLADEAYENLVFKGKPQSALEFNYEKTIVVASFSKTFRITGLRVGTVIAHPDLMRPIYQVHQYVTAVAPSFAQLLVARALEKEEKYVQELIRILDARRKVLMDVMQEIDYMELTYEPNGAFYIFPRVTLPNMDASTFSELMLQELGVVVVPGTEFGQHYTQHVRLSYGFVSQEQIEEAVERFKTFEAKHH